MNVNRELNLNPISKQLRRTELFETQANDLVSCQGHLLLVVITFGISGNLRAVQIHCFY